MSEQTEAWRWAWRAGFAPVLPTAGLEALRDALATDSPQLVQGDTTVPPPLMYVLDFPVECGCAVAFCGWRAGGLETVGEVEAFFSAALQKADERLGHEKACAPFLEFFDNTPRAEMIAALLSEVELALSARLAADTLSDALTGV